MEKRLEHEYGLLLGLFDQMNWVIRSNLPHWLVLAVPTNHDCAYVGRHFSAILNEWSRTGVEVYFEVDRQIFQATNQGEIGMATSPQALTPVIGGAIKINRQLLDVFGEMLSHPDRSIGLVRLRDERQLSVSGGAGGKFLVGASLDQVTSWKRDQYWHPEDLAEFNRTWRQDMSVGRDLWFEWRYRSFDPLDPNGGPDNCDYTFITKYRLIEGPDQELFHVAENVDMVEIAP